jgi:molecular chaperone GrpE
MDNKNNHKDKIESQENGSAKSDPEKTVTIKESEYELLKADSQKARENWDKLVRFQADFENARKRWDRDRSEFLRFANEDLLCDILTIVDELERSVELSQEKHEDHLAFLKGVAMILAHLHDLLKKNGVSCIASKGKCFDPNYHEALMQVEKDELPENTVVDEMQKGYILNDRVIRTAKVQVSKKKSKDTQTKDKEEEKQ